MNLTDILHGVAAEQRKPKICVSAGSLLILHTASALLWFFLSGVRSDA